MKHLRYIVYRHENNTNQKDVLLWTENAIHSTFARENGVKPNQICSLGYIGYTRGKWVLYEHYQLDNLSKKADKQLVQQALRTFPEINSIELARELNQTYKAEKYLIRNNLMQFISALWDRRTR